MSKISEIIDLIEAQLITTFPNHEELVVPEIPELNDDIQFEKGYGLVVADTVNTNRFVDCKSSMETTFIVVLTRKLFNGPIRSGTAQQERRNKRKSLLEDHYLFLTAIENNPTINGDGNIGKMIFQNNAGPEFVKIGRTDLYMLRSIYTVEYFENLT